MADSRGANPIFHRLVTKSGRYNQKTLEEYLRRSKPPLSMDLSKMVHLFPSHVDQHSPEIYGLYTHKDTIELSKVCPTLGLPIYGMPANVDATDPPEMAKQAIADIWAALGFGLAPVLSVIKLDNHFCTKGFADTHYQTYMANLWRKGDEPNIGLANYYQQEFDCLRAFMTHQLTFDDKSANGKPVIRQEFIEAYRRGQEERKKEMPSAFYDSSRATLALPQTAKQAPQPKTAALSKSPVSPVVKLLKPTFYFNSDGEKVLVHITPESYQRAVEDEGLDPKRTALLFPGNEVHVRAPLYGIKTGGGLAQLACELGELDIPTIGLPTIIREKEQKKRIECIHNAVKNVYKALGAGINIVIPLRERSMKKGEYNKYFPKGFKTLSQYEPSFWGENQSTPNINLANYYMEQMEIWLEISSGAINIDDEKIDLQYKKAYLEGVAARNRFEQGVPPTSMTEEMWFEPLSKEEKIERLRQLKSPGGYLPRPPERVSAVDGGSSKQPQLLHPAVESARKKLQGSPLTAGSRVDDNPSEDHALKPKPPIVLPGNRSVAPSAPAVLLPPVPAVDISEPDKNLHKQKIKLKREKELMLEYYGIILEVIKIIHTHYTSVLEILRLLLVEPQARNSFESEPPTQQQIDDYATSYSKITLKYSEYSDFKKSLQDSSPDKFGESSTNLIPLFKDLILLLRNECGAMLSIYNKGKLLRGHSQQWTVVINHIKELKMIADKEFSNRPGMKRIRAFRNKLPEYLAGCKETVSRNINPKSAARKQEIPQSIAPRPPLSAAPAGTVSATSSTFFAASTALPVAETQSPEQIQLTWASNTLVDLIKEKVACMKKADFIIRKGTQTEAIKIGFTTSEDAANFQQYLIENQVADVKDVTFYGATENHPMDENGINTTTGGGKYKFVVRFEKSADAAKYIKSLDVNETALDELLGVSGSRVAVEVPGMSS